MGWNHGWNPYLKANTPGKFTILKPQVMKLCLLQMRNFRSSFHLMVGRWLFLLGVGFQPIFQVEAALHLGCERRSPPTHPPPFSPGDCNWHPAPEDLGEVSEVFKVSRTAAPAPQASMVAGQSFRRWSWGGRKNVEIPWGNGGFKSCKKDVAIICLKHWNRCFN